MSFKRPTLTELIEQARADIEGRLPGADARLPVSVFDVLARIQAAGSHGLYGYLGWLADQLFPDSAEAEYLERLASIWSIDRKAAGYAAGSVTFTGIDATAIPAGTVLRRSDGAQFTTDAAGVIAAGSASVAVTATAAGAAGNTLAGATVNLVSPIANIDSAATVAAGGISGGTDQEDDESLRARLLARLAFAPHGGAAGDYERWALEVAGVTRAWAVAGLYGLGTVGLWFMTDDLTANGIPDAAKVTEVQTYLDGLRPITAEVTAVAPTPVVLDFTIALTPNTATVQAAVEAALKDLILRESEPGATILLSRIREAISTATGETDHSVTAPAADVTHAAAEIAVFGAITWA